MSRNDQLQMDLSLEMAAPRFKKITDLKTLIASVKAIGKSNRNRCDCNNLSLV